jgi:hypothetical protein
VIGRAARLAGMPVSAGLALGRKILTAAPGAARAIVGLVRGPAPQSATPDRPAVAVDAPVTPDASRAQPRPRPQPASAEAPPPPDPQAAAALVVDPHIEEEEPELVATLAEAGAEDGAGPEVDVAEPWEGYRGMTAAVLVERLEHATAEEAAAVQLYEGLNQNRRTVLDAASRRLATAARS